MGEALELSGVPVEADSRGWTTTLTVCGETNGKLVSLLKTSDPSVPQNGITEVLAEKGA